MDQVSGENETEKPNIILVDDDMSLILSIKRRLSGWANVFPAVSGYEALTLMGDLEDTNLIATDLRMPGMSGLDLLLEAKLRLPATKRILFTGFPDLQDIQHTVDEIGVLAVIFKPFSALDFLEYVHLLCGIADDQQSI